MNKKIFTLILALSTNFYAQSFQFSKYVEINCGLKFNSSGSIAFKNERPKKIGEFEIDTNLGKKGKYILKLKNIKKSVNLLDIENSKIYIMLNRHEKIRLEDLKSRGKILRKKKNKIHIFIDEKRENITAGLTNVSFELEVNCKE